MIVKIKDEELIKAVEDIAKAEGKDVDTVVTEMLTYSVDTAIATLAMQRIEYALIDTLIPALKNVEVNSYAVRHQVANMHADILEEPERAAAISEEATKIGHKIAFEDENEEKEEV